MRTAAIVSRVCEKITLHIGKVTVALRYLRRQTFLLKRIYLHVVRNLEMFKLQTCEFKS